MADASPWPEREGMRNKPPPDSIARTVDLMRRLVAVPKGEVAQAESQRRKRKHLMKRRQKT